MSFWKRAYTEEFLKMGMFRSNAGIWISEAFNSRTSKLEEKARSGENLQLLRTFTQFSQFCLNFYAEFLSNREIYQSCVRLRLKFSSVQSTSIKTALQNQFKYFTQPRKWNAPHRISITAQNFPTCLLNYQLSPRFKETTKTLTIRTWK